MTAPLHWSRRRFLTQGAALAMLRGVRLPLLMAEGSEPVAGSLDGGLRTRVRPLLVGQTARPRRYAPDGDGFVIRDGREIYNRPLYCGSVAGVAELRVDGLRVDGLRVDAGDLPEVSLFLPGHGGNLRLGVARGDTARWAFELAEVQARFAAGRVQYEMRDERLLGGGELLLDIQPTALGMEAMILARNTPKDLCLTWAFAGGDGKRGKADGDIGCEDVGVSRFFAFDEQNCAQTSYVLAKTEAMAHSAAGNLRLRFPEGAELHLASAQVWQKGWRGPAKVAPSGGCVLAGEAPLEAGRAVYVRVALAPKDGQRDGGNEGAADGVDALAKGFAARRRQMESLAATVRVETPDAYLGPVAGAMLVAAEALWQADERVLLEGCVAERVVSPGWRGPMALDALGQHERMREHLRFWLARQNGESLPEGLNGDEEMRAAADAGSHLTRKESLLHTNGDVAHEQRDKNLAMFEALARHVRWTGDAGFAREVWPALLRHMDWQYRLFRRVFPHPERDAPRELQALPLYEAYACVPGSENLQYNGGGVAHATAANYFLNRATASMARLLNEDPVPFDEEAALIREAMLQLLWMPNEGRFAEARDSAFPQAVYSQPALWTISRTLDAELPTPRQAWQMCADRLANLRKIPVEGENVPAGGYLLASSDWSLAEPTLNRISLAENVHFALALWQAGMAEEAYALLRGNLLDSMYLGVCPGNFHVTSALDPHRGETQRDAADPLGMVARALVEGLFGVLPDMVRGTLTLRPGFPAEWTQARLVHPEIDVAWTRDGLHETFTITSRLKQPVALTLLLPARGTSDPIVLSNGHAYPFAFDPNATGTPRLVLTNFPPATAWQIYVRWRGKAPMVIPLRASYGVGERVVPPAPLTMAQIDDPQGCLQSGLAHRPGQHAVFVHVVEEKCGYWLPIPIEITAGKVAGVVGGGPTIAVAEEYETIELATVLDSKVTELLQRSYAAPRSAFCSLAVPEHLLGGWVDDGVRFEIDDAGLRSAGGVLKTAFDIPFVTPFDRARANCRFLSFWEQDKPVVTVPLAGRAHTLYLLVTGTTLAQAARMEHGAATVTYADGTVSRLAFKAPETWWPVEQDYVTDDYLFWIDVTRPLPPRVDLRSGKTRLLEHASFKGKGGAVAGGAATVLHLPLHGDRELRSVRIECSLYGVVVALLGVTLGRSAGSQ